MTWQEGSDVYTHTWYLNPHSSLATYRRAMKAASKVVDAWVKHVRQENYLLDVSFGSGLYLRQPPGEAFILRASPKELLMQPAPIWDTERKRVHAFCKTLRLPYDTAITAVLIVMAEQLRDDIRIYSDGGVEDWQPGIGFATRVLGRPFQCPPLA